MLHAIATPIGNLGDLSPRALEAFRQAAVIACEDTRRTWQLLSHFEIPRPEMLSYRQGNEERITERILEYLRDGKEVVLCSDGGYPAISDPGYRLLRACAGAGVPYDVIPGASAVNVALLMSGLSTSSFTFRGFPPRGPGALRNWFAEDADKEHTLICYESPFRIGATLQAALEVLGDREAAVCIELTKLHERVSRGYLSELVKEYADAKVKGEVALVIAGNNPKFFREGTAGVAARGHIETIARGVLIREGKILLCKAKGGKTTYLPGGHIEFGETGKVALEREMLEETGLKASAGEFLGVVENSFMQYGTPHNEINLIYRLSLEDVTAKVSAQEDWIDFEWCSLDKLDKANLLPAEMINYAKLPTVSAPV